MGNHRHSHRLASFIAAIFTFITTAIILPGTASAQTRIISLSGDLDFGRVPFHSSSQRVLAISNLGDSALTITNLNYPLVPAWGQASFQGNWSGTIPPNSTHFVDITFTPMGSMIEGDTNDVDIQGYLNVESDATAGTNYFFMSGIGTPPPLSADVNLDFGTVPIGNANRMTLSLTNIGTVPVTISNISRPDGFFTLSSPSIILPGWSATVFVAFNPTNITNYQAIAAVTSDATDPVLVLVTPNGNVTNSPLGVNPFGVSGIGTYPTGKFVGLFAPTNNPAFDNSGYVTANCSPKGKFTATITLANKRYPFSAQVSPAGTVSAKVVRRKLPNLNVSLQFNGRREWIGTIDNGIWSANLRAAAMPTKGSGGVISPGKYPLNISGSTNSLIAPTAAGTGTLEIKNFFVAHITGTLGDGTAYSQNTVLCGFDVPFYAPLYRNHGAILGWIIFRRQPPPPSGLNPTPSLRLPADSDPIVGIVNWFKPAGIDPDFPDGFSFQTTVTGSSSATNSIP
jgi:HYDIN/CFA65/VesB family protein